MKAVQALKAKMVNPAIENPYYGKSALLALMQGATQTTNPMSLMDKAWQECKDEKHLREVFFTIVFGIGDITNRQHNLFGKTKVENGGNSQREVFMHAMQWILKNAPKQYYAFLNADLFRQYSCLFNVLATQVHTKKGKRVVTGVLNMLHGVDLDIMADYLAKLIKTAHPGEKVLIAKWLVNPRTSARQKRNKEGELIGNRELQDITKNLQQLRVLLYTKLSERMGWVVEQHHHNKRFVGMSEWKKEWNGTLESVLFSSGKIISFDEQQFVSWLDTLPSGARFRVRRRLLDGDNKLKGKWKSQHGNVDMGQWILNWEKAKAEAQSEQRKLEEKVRQGDTSQETKEKLAKVKKEAKVTTGADTLFSLFEKLHQTHITSNTLDLVAQGILDKIDFQVPVLVIADCSGSMGGLPTTMARLAATVCMLKNPSDDLDNILVRFGTNAEFLTDGSKGEVQVNRFMTGQAIQINRLVDREAPFAQNYNSLATLINARMGGTEFTSVADAFKHWLDSASDESERQVRREMIQQYPVFLVVSDGDMNNARTATESMAQFQSKMLQWFGWTGVVVVWNVSTYNAKTDYFVGLQNVIHYYGFNPGIINSIFTKIHDLDIIDVFTPLKSLGELKRYEPVRINTL